MAASGASLLQQVMLAYTFHKVRILYHGYIILMPWTRKHNGSSSRVVVIGWLHGEMKNKFFTKYSFICMNFNAFKSCHVGPLHVT